MESGASMRTHIPPCSLSHAPWTCRSDESKSWLGSLVIRSNLFPLLDSREPEQVDTSVGPAPPSDLENHYEPYQNSERSNIESALLLPMWKNHQPRWNS